MRNRDTTAFDIHDRVNYSVTSAKLDILPEERIARLNLIIDTEIGPVMEYFEIFMDRMLLCRKAAQRLGLIFRLVINEQVLL